MKPLLSIFFLLLSLSIRSYSQTSTMHTVCEDKAELTRISLTNYGTLKVRQCVASNLDGSNRTEYFTLIADGQDNFLSLCILNKAEAKSLAESIRAILSKTQKESLGKGEDYTASIQAVRFRAKGANYGKWEYTIDPDIEAFKGAIFKLSRKNMEELLNVISN